MYVKSYMSINENLSSKHWSCRSAEFREYFLSFAIVILVEQRCVNEFFVQSLALVNFASHKLPAEAIITIETLQELFFVKWLEQLGVVRVDLPVTLQTLQEGLGHMLKVAADVEIIKCYSIVTFQVEVLEDEILR